MDDGGEGGGEGGDELLAVELEGAIRGSCIIFGCGVNSTAGRVGSRTTRDRAATPARSRATSNCAKPAGPDWTAASGETNQQRSNQDMKTWCAVPGFDSNESNAVWALRASE